jgi:hypothetical protein
VIQRAGQARQGQHGRVPLLISEGPVLRSPTDPSRFQLTEQEAFEAMRCFLDQFLKSAGNDMYTLLADISILSDGATLDTAAWHDWLKCVESVAKPTAS